MTDELEESTIDLRTGVHDMRIGDVEAGRKLGKGEEHVDEVFRWKDNEGDTLGYPIGGELVAGYDEPSLLPPNSDELDPLVEVITGKVSSEVVSLEHRIARLALVISMTTTAGEAHESVEIMEELNCLAGEMDADPESRVRYSGLRWAEELAVDLGDEDLSGGALLLNPKN